MTTSIFRQPDGKFSIFCSTEEDLIATGLDDGAVVDWATAEWGRSAELFLTRAYDDTTLATWEKTEADGLRRWRHFMWTVGYRHGLDHVASLVEQMGMPASSIPDEARAGAAEREADDQDDFIEDDLPDATASAHP